MSEKQKKIRPECPFRICETARKPRPATLREKAIRKEHQIGKVCPLCGALIKEKIEEA
jgi:hypothetical protein